jgi:hypothetical protein
MVNPTQQDIIDNISAEQAAAKEEAFFDSHSEFGINSRVSSDARSRLGIDALRMQLSEQLVELTKRELPKMQTAVTHALEEVRGGGQRRVRFSCASLQLQVHLMHDAHVPLSYSTVGGCWMIVCLSVVQHAC